jgi:hypothetical protein
VAQDDYAILVGISRYRDKSLRKLDGPVRDVELMRRWLVDAQGGNVPEAHVITIVSDEAVEPPPGATLPPVVQDFENAFAGVLLDPQQSEVIRRPNGRLYLFFSGHGFCERLESSPQAALYVANATRLFNYNICGTLYAHWARDQAAFGEVVLVMDCCRDSELYKQVMSPPLRLPSDPAPAQQCKLFEIYAAPRGGKAQERSIPERGAAVHGLLTHALMLAFDHAAPEDASPSTQDIKGYIQENWKALFGEQVDRPEIVTPPNGEFKFGRAQAKDVMQGFKLVKAASGSEFTVFGGASFNELARFVVTGSEARVERNGQTSSVPVDDGRFMVPLPSTICLVTGIGGGALIQSKFQVGGPDVEL